MYTTHMFLFVKALRFSAGVAALVSTVFVAAPAEAALVFESEAPIYSVNPTTGTPQATVRLLLVQTEGTTTVTDGGGLNSYGLRVSPQNPPANPVRLVAVQSNPNFNFDSGLDENGNDLESNYNLQTGQVNDSRRGTTTGVAAESPNRWYLATFTYSLQTAGGQLANTTTFQITRYSANSDDILTATGPNASDGLDDQVQTGTFTITAVPEPATAAILSLGGLGLIARRRRRSPA